MEYIIHIKNTPDGPYIGYWREFATGATKRFKSKQDAWNDMVRYAFIGDLEVW